MSKRRELAPSRSRRRPYSPKRRKKRFLLYCEGEVTERHYFQDLVRFLRSPLIEVKVAPDRRKDPKRLVELAKEARGKADREARNARDDSLRYDEVWCVFDCDEHKRLKPAVDQATALELGLAVSNPCFDLWLLLEAGRYKPGERRTARQPDNRSLAADRADLRGQQRFRIGHLTTLGSGRSAASFGMSPSAVCLVADIFIFINVT